MTNEFNQANPYYQGNTNPQYNQYGNGFMGSQNYGARYNFSPNKNFIPQQNLGNMIPPNQNFIPQNPSTNKIYATGIEEVKAMRFPFNSDYIILDNDRAILYRKVVDGTGKMNVEAFDIIPHEEKPKEEKNMFDTSMFAQKSDVEEIKSELDRLKGIMVKSLDINIEKK